jgi:hypothetical protein
MKVRSHTTVICPIVQWLAVAIQATSAISQSPMTPVRIGAPFNAG